MIIIDAKDLIMGRLATKVAKMALLGENIAIVNCEKCCISGDPIKIKGKYDNAVKRGVPLRGPYISRSSDRLLRRCVRGMLPYKQEKGKDAFSRVMTYLGVPVQFKDQETTTFEDIKISKLPNLKYVYLKEVSKHIGSNRLGE